LARRLTEKDEKMLEDLLFLLLMVVILGGKVKITIQGVLPQRRNVPLAQS